MMDVYWTVNRWCIHKPILSRHGRIHSFQLSELQALYNKVHGGKNGKTLDNVFAYVTKCSDFVTPRIFSSCGDGFFFIALHRFQKTKKLKAIKRMFALPIVAMLLVGGFSACSQDDDLFEYDLGNDEVATLAKRSMPRNGESIVPSGQRDEVSVTFVPEDPNYGSMTVSVSYSYKKVNGVWVASFITYTPYIPDFSVDEVSIGAEITPGHYWLNCKGSNAAGVKYYGSSEVLL